MRDAKWMWAKEMHFTHLILWAAWEGRHLS